MTSGTEDEPTGHRPGPGWKQRQYDKRCGGDPDAPVCVSRGKHRYPGEEAALAALPGKSRLYGLPLRAYDCPECEFWHLTSDPPVGENGEPAWSAADLARRWNTVV
jgi:hypothetical protein